MTLAVCMEKMEDRWIAYINNLPGCFASHEQREEALALLPQAIQEYIDWCRWNGVAITGIDAGEPLQVQEIVQEWFYPDGTAVNAFFAADSQPLSSAESSMAAALLDWTRADLLKAVDGLATDVMDRPVVGEWNISGIFHHTVRSDWWYLRALDLIPEWKEAPIHEGLAAALEWTHAYYLSALPGLVGSKDILQKTGEIWTARKMLRRALWHRRDHTSHIYQFREALGIGS